MKKTSTSTVPSLRDLALDVIGRLSDELRKADPTLTKAQAVAKAAQTPEGRSAYSYYTMPGAHLPVTEVLDHLAGGEGYLAAGSMRDHILAKRQLAKVGNNGGAGPKGSNIESPPVSGPKRPADTIPATSSKVKPAAGGLPATPPVKRPDFAPYIGAPTKKVTPVSPSDAIYAKLRADAIAANPTMPEAHAIAAHLSTTAGQAQHRAWNAAREAERGA